MYKPCRFMAGSVEAVVINFSVNFLFRCIIDFFAALSLFVIDFIVNFPFIK